MAVTRGPGLIGALLVGVSSAKALAAVHRLPLVPVDHLHGHVVASTLRPDPIEPPYLCLVASGGHTFIARVDDAVLATRSSARRSTTPPGEAFDKGARLLGLGYPGGPDDRPAGARGRPATRSSSRAAPPGDGLDFSFSGLKTVAALPGARPRRGRGDAPARRPRGLLPARDRGRARCARSGRRWSARAIERLAIGGGVAANSELRARRARRSSVPTWVPPLELCTDNAAMIAAAARFSEPLPYPGYLALDAAARLG